VTGGLRQRFEARLPFPLDPFQSEALDAVDAGHSVLVAAPTGSGKTLVAEYAVEVALASGRKAFYTSPLKALSNQKYLELAARCGSERVGLLTGDNAIRPDAPVVVMTTEVLRNMIYAGSDLLAGLRYVVLDEVHYLQDRVRGAVWEEVIIHLPPEVRLVCLSATVSNAEELADWIRAVRGETAAVIEERRPVELTHLYAVAERGRPGVRLLPTFVTGEDGRPRPNPAAQRLDAAQLRRGRPRRGRLASPSRVEMVETLAEADMLPAIVFVFSRAGCDHAVEQCLRAGVRLTDSGERRRLRAIAEAHTGGLGADDLEALGGARWLEGFLAGVAAHHAGMVPPMKEAVEEAFAAGLVKVVYATETLSLGINMPARTVVIEKLSKFTGEHHEFLTPGEYTQLTGRAGRRGIDELGYAVVCWSPFVPFDQVAGLASRRSYTLTSSFRPTYNMAANLVQRYPPEEAHHLLNLSFAQWRADRDVVGLERRLERTVELIAHHRDAASCERGDVRAWRARHAPGPPATDGPEAVAAALGALRPGDVLSVGRAGGRVVVLRQEHGRGGGRVLAVGEHRDLLRLGPADFSRPPRPAGHLQLPTPFAPRSPAYRRAVRDLLRRLPPGSGPGDAGAPAAPSSEPAGSGPDGVEACPDLPRHLRALEELERLERERSRLERRIRGRNESLARQLDRVLRVLAAWGYVDGWRLTAAGRALACLTCEADLLLAEALRTGCFDDLDPAEVAALTSCLAYERRGPEVGGMTVRAPTRRLGERIRALEGLWRDLRLAEDDAGLPETRRPDPGLVEALWAWARGAPLAEVLADEEDLTGGDFVRVTKLVIDLLGQIAEVAPGPGVAAAARQAADACLRGVVAASGLVET
jgi:ATP-dependent RNA helicase HelY